MMNNLMIMGRLTADPKLNNSGNADYCRFSIAVDRPKRKGDDRVKTDFFSCIAWDGTARVISRYYTKGDLLVLGGHIRNNRYEKNGESLTSTEILVREIHFTNTRKSDSTKKSEIMPETEYTENNLPF